MVHTFSFNNKRKCGCPEITKISLPEKPRKSKDTVYNPIEGGGKTLLFEKAKKRQPTLHIAEILATLSQNENFTRLRKNKIKIYTYSGKSSHRHLSPSKNNGQLYYHKEKF